MLNRALRDGLESKEARRRSRASETSRPGLLSIPACLLIVLCSAFLAVLPTGLAFAAELPDGRIYEQVTPEEKLGSEVYQPPVPFEDTHDEFEVKQSRGAGSETETEYTFQAAADGGGIAYVGGPTVGGNENEGFYGGNEYLATRSAGGAWSSKVLSPEGAPGAIFQAFTPNLSTAFVNSEQLLSPLAPGSGEEEEYSGFGYYDTLYAMGTAGNEFRPFYSTKPPYRPMVNFGTANNTFKPPRIQKNAHRDEAFLAFEGASADYTQLLFAANDALTGASEGRPAAEGGEGSEFEVENNLYESVEGQLRLVNVLPDGSTHANAVFGGLESAGQSGVRRPILSRVISADGSRVFWTDLSTGHIYMREDGTRTVEISPEGTYQTATSDGSTVFYTNGDLYAYEVAGGHTTDLTPGVTVERVVGASENGDYVYYMTEGWKLAVWHDGVSTQITSSSAPIGVVSSSQPVTAEATPDGHSIVFTTWEVKDYPETGENDVQRVEVYDAETNTLHCASCTSYGTLGELQTSNAANVYQPRWITTDGSRVFFVSWEGLAPQDTNEIQDVYEWARPGTAGCAEAGGCVYLLSGGTSTAHSAFLDASESGNDVFIVTRANLVSGDEDGLFDVYDVRTGKQPPAQPQCTGTGCQGVPTAPPIFATPSTVTFAGLGNLPTPKAHGGKQSKSKGEPNRAKQLRRALVRCRRQHRANARTRSACERKTRDRYGAKAAQQQRGHAAGQGHHNGRGK